MINLGLPTLSKLFVTLNNELKCANGSHLNCLNIPFNNNNGVLASYCVKQLSNNSNLCLYILPIYLSLSINIKQHILIRLDKCNFLRMRDVHIKFIIF